MQLSARPTLAFFIRFFLIALAVIASACGSATTEKLISFDNEKLTVLGRHVATDDGLKMGWPGSGLALSFHGQTFSIEIEDDGHGIMDVVINGQEHTPLKLKAGVHRYSVVDVTKSANFDVSVTRRTEVFDTGLFTIRASMIDGRLLNRDRPNRKILFMGDSITAGFGVRGTTKDCEYDPSTNAPLQAYASLTADTLAAEAQLIAISGRGVVHNWDANPAPVMPMQIDYALPDDVAGPLWDHSKFTPDVIVTTLGTNDWSVINPGRDKFRSGYLHMLRNFRTRFPAAHIVTVNGPLLGGEKGAAIRDGIDFAMDAMADNEISTLDVSLSNTGIKWSCNSHPGRDSMAKIARELSVHITQQTGWDLRTALPMITPPDLPKDGQTHFKNRVQAIDGAPIIKNGVMLIGDSITEGWLGREDLLPVRSLTNHGVGWDTTAGVLARMPQISRHNPNKIFVMIGTNDLSWGVAKTDIKANYKTLIEILKKRFPKADIYVQSILPRDIDKRDEVHTMNKSLRENAVQAGVTWIDLTDEFSADDGTLDPTLTYDGLHLNDAGYALWAEQLRPHLD
ncbi:GDSL-type esterase/lipase family protein [Fretibacter rubidus]|uniref:GDSL-type esterase/lipase family protein n=1 Tax=Fretibacter rubidus TaxID=570162 RepID=UPI00352B9DBA